MAPCHCIKGCLVYHSFSHDDDNDDDAVFARFFDGSFL